jgi:ABC-2 type transport system permease protein
VSLSRSAAIARHELRILRHDVVAPVLLVVMPLILMVFVKPAFAPALVLHGYPSANGAEQAVPGMAVMFSFFLLGTVGFTFFREHGWSTWQRLRASCASPAEIMTGKAVVPLLIAVVQFAVLFGVGGLLFDLRIRGPVMALVGVGVALAICLVALGLAVVAVCRTIMQVNAVSNIAAIGLAGIGGALTPIPALPEWARTLAPATPSYWAMRGYRSVILDGSGAVLLPVTMLLGFALLFAVVAAFRFRIDDAKTSWA